jgi:hypothetical protein
MAQSKACGLERVESVAVIRGADMVMIPFLRRSVIVRETRKSSTGFKGFNRSIKVLLNQTDLNISIFFKKKHKIISPIHLFYFTLNFKVLLWKVKNI